MRSSAREFSIAAVALLFVFTAGVVSAQSLAELAAKEKERRKHLSGTNKVYTNDDLERISAGEAHPAATPAPRGSRSGADDASSESDARKRQEAFWRADLGRARGKVRAAEARVADLEARIADLSEDRRPSPPDLLDPSRLQKREAEKRKAIGQLEEAREALADARKALDALLEEARRKGVPPGWLREP